MIVSVNFMVENVIQIKTGITINIILSVKDQKNIVYANTFMLGILFYVLVSVIEIVILLNI